MLPVFYIFILFLDVFGLCVQKTLKMIPTSQCKWLSLPDIVVPEVYVKKHIYFFIQYMLGACVQGII